MNTKMARKALPHRFNDVMNCLKWRRYLRLHIASNLLTGLCTVIEHESRNEVESGLMVSLKVALLSKDTVQLREFFAACQENRKCG